jgi:hypothetical protein
MAARDLAGHAGGAADGRPRALGTQINVVGEGVRASRRWDAPERDGAVMGTGDPAPTGSETQTVSAYLVAQGAQGALGAQGERSTDERVRRR